MVSKKLKLGISLFLMLVVFPAVLAVVGYIAFVAKTSPPRHANDSALFTEKNYEYEPDSEIGFRPKPNRNYIKLTGEGRVKTPVFTDDHGARVATAGESLPKHVDILTVGCSQAWGQGIPWEQTFGAQAAKQLNFTERNFAISGQGGVASYLMAKRYAHLHPKIILYGMWEDHLNRNTRRCAQIDAPLCMPLPHIRKDDNKYLIVKPSFSNLQIKLLRSFYATMGSDRKTHSLLDDFFWSAQSIWYRFRDNMDAKLPLMNDEREKAAANNYVLGLLNDTAKNVGAKLVVVYIPYYFDKIIPVNPLIAQFARSHGIVLIDMTPQLSKMKTHNERIAIEFDGHLTPQAHALIADAIIKNLHAIN